MITYSAPEIGISDAMYVRESTCCNGYNSATGTFSLQIPLQNNTIVLQHYPVLFKEFEQHDACYQITRLN
jgi:hypothetical protein